MREVDEKVLRWVCGTRIFASRISLPGQARFLTTSGCRNAYLQPLDPLIAREPLFGRCEVMTAARAGCVLEHVSCTAFGACNELGYAFVAIGHARKTRHVALHPSRSS